MGGENNEREGEEGAERGGRRHAPRIRGVYKDTCETHDTRLIVEEILKVRSNSTPTTSSQRYMVSKNELYIELQVSK